VLTANSCKAIVLIHRKTPKMRCAVKGAYVFRFEYWLDTVSAIVVMIMIMMMMMYL
jgi:hypothetical protein